jgi:hypothetical protein
MATWLIAGEDEEDMELRHAELGRSSDPIDITYHSRADHAEIERLCDRYGVTGIVRSWHWSGTPVLKRYDAQRGRGRDAVVEDVTAQVLADGQGSPD